MRSLETESTPAVAADDLQLTELPATAGNAIKPGGTAGAAFWRLEIDLCSDIREYGFNNYGMCYRSVTYETASNSRSFYNSFPSCPRSVRNSIGCPVAAARVDARKARMGETR